MQKDGARAGGRSASNPLIIILRYGKATSLADEDMWMSEGSVSDPSVGSRRKEGQGYLLPL
jgi:hypothetical protein